MKNLKITVNGVTYDVQVEEVGGVVTSAPVAAAPVAAPVAAPAPAAAPAAPAAAPAPAPAAAAPVAGAESIDAPMPGTILDIKVKAGDSVKNGDVLVILEAMKMENEIVAPRDGVIAAVCVTKGEAVNSGSALISLS